MALTKEEQVTLDLLLKKRDGQTKKLVHVISLLDKSGSMVTGKSRTISAFNENAQIMRSEEDENTRVTSTFITFESSVKVVFAQAGVNRLEPLTDKSFVPSGGTALYDGIGDALNLALSFEAASDANTSFLLQITTDGEENASKRFQPHHLKSRIEELQKSGRWTITVMGPKGSIDLFAETLGVARGNLATFDASSVRSRGFAANATVASTQNYFKSVKSGAGAVMDSYSSIAPSGSVDDPVI